METYKRIQNTIKDLQPKYGKVYRDYICMNLGITIPEFMEAVKQIPNIQHDVRNNYWI